MAKMSKKWAVLCSTAIAAVYAAGYFTTETQASVQQPQQIQANSQASDVPSNGGSTDSGTTDAQPTQQTQGNTQVSDGTSQAVSAISSTTNVQPAQQTKSNTQASSGTTKGVSSNSSSSAAKPTQQTQVNPTNTNAGQSKGTPVATNSTKANSRYKDGTYTGMGSNRRGSIQVTVSIKSDKITDVEISDFGMHYSERDVEGLPQEVLQKQSASVRNVSGATYSTQAFEDAVRDALSQAVRNA